ncbi:MAG: DUF4321 domain-containing protein [Lachnospira sp.]
MSSSISKYKNGWLLLLFILIGVVVGGLLGEAASHVNFLNWLSYGQTFGLSSDNPLVLDLGVLVITFAFRIKITIATIIGVILSILIYKVI